MSNYWEITSVTSGERKTERECFKERTTALREEGRKENLLRVDVSIDGMILLKDDMATCLSGNIKKYFVLKEMKILRGL